MVIHTLRTKTEDFKKSITKKIDFGQVCDLPFIIARLKQSVTWANGELNSMVLLNTPQKKILITVMHKDTLIDSFQSHESITLKVIEGKIGFQSRSKSANLEKGDLLTLHDKVTYRLRSKEETVFLMTINIQL